MENAYTSSFKYCRVYNSLCTWLIATFGFPLCTLTGILGLTLVGCGNDLGCGNGWWLLPLGPPAMCFFSAFSGLSFTSENNTQKIPNYFAYKKLPITIYGTTVQMISNSQACKFCILEHVLCVSYLNRLAKRKSTSGKNNYV